MSIKLGWKVMRISDKGELLSLRQGSGARKYSASKWTAPRRNCGPLAVFDTKEHACRFAANYGLRGLSLCRCEYVPSNELRLWVREQFRVQYLSPSSEPSYGFQTKAQIGILPLGTVLASKVRLKTRSNINR